MNQQAVAEAIELAQAADLRGLESMKLPPSPKLQEWHGRLVQELSRQLNAAAKEPMGGEYRLAPSEVQPPTSSSYWVVPGCLLAGAYPGDADPAKHRKKVKAILDAGVTVFINLMEENEKDHSGNPFVPYQGVVKEYRPGSECLRFPIRDLTAPSASQMEAILDAIDQCLAANKNAYVHCWGGVGRTGTVVGCWLLRHGLAEPANVIEVLEELRQQDQERRHRKSPETAEQERLVKKWPAMQARN